jgi:hypothetical protein
MPDLTTWLLGIVSRKHNARGEGGGDVHFENVAQISPG